MLLKLSKNAFVRQYGDFTYVLQQIKNYDQMFMDAEVFMRWIGRGPMEKSEILRNICGVYAGADAVEIARDFDAFITPLIDAKVIIVGETAESIEVQEESFSYDVENPKTMDTHIIKPEEMVNGPVTQDVLEKYFAEHPTVFGLQIDITQACTERCVHCYRPEYNPVFLPLAQIKKVIDEFRAQGGIRLTLSGGECMLHPDFDEIVRYARTQDLIVSILSNLTLCSDEKIKVLQDAEATVQASLYSMDPAIHDAITKRPGSFETTKAAIEKLRALQIPCRIACPTMKSNFKGYLDVLEYARSLKMDAKTDFIIMGKMDCDTSNLACRLDLQETRCILEDIAFKAVPVNREYFDPAKKETVDEEWAKRKVCGACVSSICLDATGFYFPCAGFAGVNLGSCYEHDLKWIWTESPETKRIRAVSGKDFPKCLHCPDRDYCSVCMCRNFNETGDIFTPSQYFCDVAKLNHEIVDEAQAKRLTEMKQ